MPAKWPQGVRYKRKAEALHRQQLQCEVNNTINFLGLIWFKTWQACVWLPYIDIGHLLRQEKGIQLLREWCFKKPDWAAWEWRGLIPSKGKLLLERALVGGEGLVESLWWVWGCVYIPYLWLWCCDAQYKWANQNPENFVAASIVFHQYRWTS